MRLLKPLQLAFCVVLGLGVAVQASSQVAPPDGGPTWVPITCNPPEAAQQSNCGNGYYTCSMITDVFGVIHPYCCLTWQTDPYNPYCEEYDIWHCHCAAGATRLTDFTKYNRYFNENCGVDNSCY